jgi:large subunit ribosomal protein L25
MEIAKILARKRPKLGSNHTASLRAAGHVPAVMYGDDRDVMPLSLDQRELETHLRHHHRIYEVDVDGEPQAAYLQDVQWDCLTDLPLHVDFKRIRLHEAIEVEVELTFLGHPVGAREGGQLNQDRHSVTVSCLPTKVPDTIEVNVSALELNQEILAGQLVLPEGVALVTEADTVVCHVMMPRAQVEAAEAPTEPELVGGGAPEGEKPEAEAKGDKGDKGEKKA